MSLIALTQDLEPFPVDNRGLYHHIMSLIISQRIRFRVAQAIRRRIYELQARGDLVQVMDLTAEQRVKVKLGEDKWQIMTNFHNYWSTTDKSPKESLASVSGIGPWTVQCAQIMSGDYSCGFITGDLAVRKWLGQALGLKQAIRPKQIEQLVQDQGLTTEQAGLVFSKIWNHTRH